MASGDTWGVPVPGWLRNLVKGSPLWPLLRPRRFHAYCVGAAKTGTVAVAAMLRGRYRSAHEPTFHEVIDTILDVSSGRLGPVELRRWLLERDRRLRLEMESSHPMASFAAELAETFPEALFILTVRDPRSWLDSIINQHLNVDVSKRRREKALRDHLYGGGMEPADGNDAALLERGLYTVTGYLRAWARHNERVLDSAPAKRLLVLRTEELDRRAPDIAGFLGVAGGSVEIGKRRLHTAPRRHGVVAGLDQELLERRIREICGPVAERINLRLGATGGVGIRC